MSSIDAREPSRITCVPESTFSFLSLLDSVSVLFDRSKFCTFPVSDVLLELVSGVLEEAVAPELPLIPEDVADPVEPVVPRLPWLESRDVVPVESELIDEPVPPEPIDPDLVSLVLP